MWRRDAAAVGVAGVALGDIHLLFHVAGVVLGDIDFYSGVAGVALMALGWLWRRAWFLVWRRGRRGCWRGMRGTWRHPSSFHVAGVVLVDIDFYSGVAGVALMALGWPWRRAWFLVWRRDAAAVGVAGMALGDIHLRFTVAGVVLGDIDFHFCVAGVARMALGWLLVARLGFGVERRGTAAVGMAGVALGDIHHSFCVAGVALGDIHLPLLRGMRGTYGTGLAPMARSGWSGTPGRRGCWRGKRRTYRHHTFVLRGRRGTG